MSLVENGLLKVGTATFLLGAGGLIVDNNLAEAHAQAVQERPQSEEVNTSRKLVSSYEGTRNLLLEASPEIVPVLDNHPRIITARVIIEQEQANRNAYNDFLGFRNILWASLLAVGGSAGLTGIEMHKSTSPRTKILKVSTGKN